MARPNIGDLIPFLKLGETSSTAYRGDRGKDAYDHISGNVSSLAVHGLRVNSESGLLEYWDGTEYVEVKGGGTFSHFKNTETLVSVVSSVAIGIPEYDSTRDLLLVFKNTVYVEENSEYTIDGVNNEIDKVSGTWDSGTVFNFIVIKSVADVAPEYDGALIIDGSIAKTKLTTGLQGEIDGKALYKNGTGTFTSGVSHQVNDAFVTENTAITVAPTGTAAGTWTVNSYNGYFVITSDATESSVAFDWWGVK